MVGVNGWKINMFEAKMKYVAVSVKHPGREKEREYIFIFPEFINHDNYLETIRRCQDRSDYCNPKRVEFTLVGAGFTDGKQCWGNSETLRCKSRGEEDSKLITRFQGDS